MAKEIQIRTIDLDNPGKSKEDTTTAPAHISESAMAYHNKRQKQRRRRTTYWVVVITLVAFFFAAGTLADWIFGPDHWLTEAALDNALDAQNIGGFFSTGTTFGTVLQVFTTLLLAFIIIKLSWLVTTLLSKRAPNRRKTILSMLNNFVKYITIIVFLVVILGVMGVPIATLLAGMGVLGIVIGFGAQSLISDIIAGLFIIVENSFQVGDIITFNGNRGEVEHIGLRTTKIQGIDGNVTVINNSEMRVIINMTQYRSVAISDVTIEYSENFERVEKVIKDNLDEIALRLEKIMEGPMYLGPIEFNPSGVTLRVIAKCEEPSRMQLTRDLNREMKILFDKHKIKFAIPNVSVQSTPKK